MKIRNKLLLILLLSSMLPLSVMALRLYVVIGNSLTDRLTSELGNIAGLQKQRIEESIEYEKYRVQAITSRVLLRTELEKYNKSPGRETAANIDSILNEAIKGTSGVKAISIADPSGKIVSSTDKNTLQSVVETAIFNKGKNSDDASVVHEAQDGRMMIHLSGPFLLEGAFLGVVIIEVEARVLGGIGKDYAGLGKTGDIYLVERASNGDIIPISPLRFDKAAAFKPLARSGETNLSANRALSGQEGVYTDTIDYKGANVLSATRFIKDPGWGLVVEIDRAEALAPIRGLSTEIAISIFFGTIILMLLVGLTTQTITRPITQMSAVAKSISSGDLTERAKVTGHDELSLLASSFNTMTDKLVDLHNELEGKVEEQTKELRQKVDQLESTKSAMLNILEDLDLARAKTEEERLRDEALLASIGEGLVVIDINGNISRINKAALETFGYKEEEELVGKWYPKAIRAVDEKGIPIEQIDSPVIQALGTGKPISQQLYYIKKDGSIFPAFVTVSPVLQDDKPVGVIQVFRDVTKEVELERSKSEFVSLASHQLRTPATGVMAWASMLKEGDAGRLNAKQALFVQKLYDSNERQLRIIDDLLNVARVDSGSIILTKQKTDLSAMIGEVVNEQLPTFKAREQKIEAVTPKGPVETEIDPQRIRMVLDNLVSNASKYTPNRGKIKISLKRSEKNITVSVSDSGVGVAQKDMDKLFKRFSRVENQFSTSRGGTGLGLYLVKKIIDLHQGSITVDSVPGKGSTFTVTLPVSVPAKKFAATANSIVE